MQGNIILSNQHTMADEYICVCHGKQNVLLLAKWTLIKWWVLVLEKPYTNGVTICRDKRMRILSLLKEDPFEFILNNAFLNQALSFCDVLPHLKNYENTDIYIAPKTAIAAAK